MKGANNTYWGNIKEGITSSLVGLRLTWKHMWAGLTKKRRNTEGPESDNYFTQDAGLITLQYPNESMPIPDNGRYRLHNEIDDCIVCDKCAKVCPVDCIDIEPIRSAEEIGKTSDGSSKRLYAAKFDIDMAKCCYCGLCTTVCPTECLTMTKAYDYSEFDITNMNYHFSDLSPEEAKEKQKEFEEYQAQKQAASGTTSKPSGSGGPKPAMKAAVPKPKISMKGIKPAGKKEEGNKDDKKEDKD